MPQDPFRPADDDARALAARLVADARAAALGVILPGTGEPMVTRVAFALTPEGAPLTVVSDLAPHTAALRANPAASLLIGEPGGKGDPLARPRLTLQVRAAFATRDSDRRAVLRAAMLARQPKAALYIDFADFHLVEFTVRSALLNGGFGRAYRLSPADLGL